MEEEQEKQERKIDELIEIVCEVLKIDHDDLISSNQKRVYTEARMIIADVILDRFTRYTLKRVGEKLGGRAHSTMINSMRTYRDLYKVDKEFRGKVLNVKHYTNGI
jgi:chromosomal replication initiation ATPase DnaA